MSLNYDSIEALVHEHIIPSLADNIYDASAYLAMARRDGVVIAGGSVITQPVLYAKNTARGGYVGMEPLDVSEPETRTRAQYNYGDYYVSIVVSGQDERKVNGQDAVLNLINTKMMEARESMTDQVASDIYTGSSYIVGFDTAIAAGTYAGIAGGTYTWWQSGVDSSAHTAANMKNSSHASYIHQLFRNAWDATAVKNYKPNLILTSQDVYDIYEITLQTNARYAYASSRTQFMADAGFSALEFRGIPVVVDNYISSGTASYCYFLNTKFAPLFYHPDNNFRMTPWKVPTNADGRIAQLFYSAQIGLTNRRLFYKFTDLAN